MNSGRMSFNVWLRLKWVFTNPFNEPLIKRWKSFYYILSWWKDILFWKDSFPFLFKLKCFLFKHKYHVAIYNRENGHILRYCTVCGKHNLVDVICKLKKIH